MALSKHQIAAELADRGLGGKNQIANILSGLAELAQEEIASGEGFTVPDIAKIDFAYTTPRTKGEMYKKGETYTGFGGVEVVAEADSKERKASVKLKATPSAAIKRLAPSAKDRKAQTRFLSTRTGKRVKERKG